MVVDCSHQLAIRIQIAKVIAQNRIVVDLEDCCNQATSTMLKKQLVTNNSPKVLLE
jgi:hypothetical protein